MQQMRESINKTRAEELFDRMDTVHISINDSFACQESNLTDIWKGNQL